MSSSEVLAFKEFFCRKGALAEDILQLRRSIVVSRISNEICIAYETFAPNCIIHMAGAPEPNLSLAGFKELVTGLLTAFPDFQVTVEDQVVSGDKVILLPL